MTIEIEIKGTDAINEIYDLRNFIQEQQISDLQVQLKEQPSVDGTMSYLEIAGIVATVAGELAIKAGLEMALEKPIHSLAETIRLWLKKRKKEGKDDIEVYTEQNDGNAVKTFVTDSNGLTTQLNKLNFAIDVKNTRVLLIGNSEFDFNFPAIKPVKGNVEDFYQMLTDKKIMGIPPENITVALNKTSGEIEEQLLLLSRLPGIETLIIYYAGHGYKADAKKLFLVAKNSKKIGDHIISGVDFDFIKNVILRQSSASQKIVILDACHSGIATQGEDDFLAGFDVKGTYIFTSSSGDEVSYFNTENDHTFFTGEMINVFKNGLENNHEKIALKDIYETVAQNLKEKNFPEPRYKNELNIPLANFYIARNLKFSVEKWKQKARQLLMEGKTDEALQEFNQLRQHYPDDDNLKAEIEKSEKDKQYFLLVNAADVFFQDQEYEKAIKKYNLALEIKQEFSVLAKRNKCEEYFEIQKKLIEKNMLSTTADLAHTIPYLEEKEAAVKKRSVAVDTGKELQKNVAPFKTVLQQTAEKKWYLAILIHFVFFGFGLFYVNPAAKRKWLYPACAFISVIIVLLATSSVTIVQRDESYIFRIIFFAGIAIGYLGGLIECIIALAGKMSAEKTQEQVLHDEKLIAKAKKWVYLFCGVSLIQFFLILSNVHCYNKFIFKYENYSPLLRRIESYTFLFSTPVFIFLLLMKYRSGWVIAMIISILRIAAMAGPLVTIYRLGYQINAGSIGGILFAFFVCGLLVFILNRKDVKMLYKVSDKIFNQVLLFSIFLNILYFTVLLYS